MGIKLPDAGTTAQPRAGVRRPSPLREAAKQRVLELGWFRYPADARDHKGSIVHDIPLSILREAVDELGREGRVRVVHGLGLEVIAASTSAAMPTGTEVRP